MTLGEITGCVDDDFEVERSGVDSESEAVIVGDLGGGVGGGVNRKRRPNDISVMWVCTIV